MAQKKSSNADALLLLILLVSISIPFIAWQEPDTLPAALVGFSRYVLPLIGLATAAAIVLLLHRQNRLIAANDEPPPPWKKKAYLGFIVFAAVLYLIRVGIALTRPGGPLAG